VWSTTAWVFVSIAAAHGDEPKPLKDVLGTGDYINRAIMSKDELELGVNQLLGLSLIDVEDERFRLTPSGRFLYEQASHPRSVHQTCVAVTHLIDELGRYESPGWKISDADVRHAVAEYRRDFAAAYAGLKTRDRTE
jgi:hypothetical protein